MPLKPFQRSVRRPYPHLPMDKEAQLPSGNPLNPDFRPQVAAIGRRGTPLCKHAAELRQQLALCHAYHNVVLLHASLRVPLPELGADARDRYHQALAASDASAGSGTGGSSMEFARGAHVSRSSLTPNIDV